MLSVIYHPVYSGPHNRTAIVARELERQGIATTTVLIPEEGVDAAARLRSEGVDVVTMPLHRMRAIPSPKAHLDWIRHLRSEATAIAQLIHERNIDVVATNTLPNLHGALAARRANVPCVWQIIDTFSPPLARRIYTPFVLKLSDVVMTTGVKVADAHPGVKELGDRWITFYPCVDTDRYRRDRATRDAARAELGIPTDATVIGNVAAMSPMKGHKYFIRAAADIKRSHPDAHFVILGSRHAGRDDYYRSLWSEAESLGLRMDQDLIVRDPGRRVAELAQAFDVFWMTSEPRSEGIPTAIGEAKALGIPVVTTDVGSTSECVTDGVSGFVVAPRDPSAIASATRVILNDADLYKAFAERARMEALEQYSVEVGAQRHALAYRRALESRSAGTAGRRS